jgi:nitrogen fixation protein FixH
MTQIVVQRKNGKFILFCFLGFFGFVTMVDSLFVYMALKTNTGLVTQEPYEKGLAYNEVLDRAKEQPSLRETASYQNSIFQWKVLSEQGTAIDDAQVFVKFIRPIQDGYDFSVKLTKQNDGIYRQKIDFPLPGLWVAKMSAQWNNQTYQTSHEFMVQ